MTSGSFQLNNKLMRDWNTHLVNKKQSIKKNIIKKVFDVFLGSGFFKPIKTMFFFFKLHLYIGVPSILLLMVHRKLHIAKYT